MRPVREYGLVALIFALLTIALTYPQIRFLDSHVGMHYDGLFSIWRLAWFAHQLPRDPLHLFDANIFYPEKNTLAYSDALLFQNLMTAPLMWAGMNAVVAYNVVLLLSFVAAGLGMYAWLSRRGMPRFAAFVGALLFAFQPYRFAHFPQLELLWTCFIPVGFLALERIVERARLGDGVLLGLAVALQVWSCLYYAVFLVTGLAIVAPFLLVGAPRDTWRAIVRPIVVAVAIAAALSMPYALPYLQTQELRQNRGDELVNWSATPESYVSTTHESWFYRHPAGQAGPLEGVLFPGFLTLALAAVGIATGLRHKRTIAYAVLGVIAFDLSLGVFGVLFAPLRELVFLYAGLRVPARLFVLVSCAFCVLAAHGVTFLLANRPRRTQAIATTIIAIVVIAETISVPLPLLPVPESTRVYSWLRDQPRGVVFEWPVPSPSDLGHTRTPDYMYFSIQHWHPMAVGYSGGYPRSYLNLLEETKTFPDFSAIRRLQEHGVTYLILHSAPDAAAYTQTVVRLSERREVQFVFADRTATEEVSLYRVTPRN